MSRKIIVAVWAVFTVHFLGCGNACNVLLPSKGIQIPPYVIEYYQKDELERLSADKKATPEMWSEVSWGDQFEVDFKVERIEGSGIYFYRLLYKMVNSTEEKVTIYDKNIKLFDITSNSSIEQVSCWNWQRQSNLCNVAEINPGGEVTKEIRYGFSVEEGFAPRLRITMSGKGSIEGESVIELYAKEKKR
jgi:hypothetical protein